MFRKICIVLALLGASLMVVAQEEQPNPCSYTKCGYGANCELTESGQARCVCPSVCPQYIKPICGSDGVTYGNPCFMKIAACRNKKDVSQKSDGPCPTNGTKSGKSC